LRHGLLLLYQQQQLLVLLRMNLAACARYLTRARHRDATRHAGTAAGCTCCCAHCATSTPILRTAGGGWCYDAGDCYGRAHTTLGSSKQWASAANASGIIGNDCEQNPTFCSWNKVYVPSGLFLLVMHH
jgi:hypothetical protein